MSTIKDLFENEELMNNIVEDLEDFPEDTPVGYEVWALGYSGDEDASHTEDEVLVGEFLDPEEAIAFAEKVNFEIINELGEGELDQNTAYFSIEVETVVDDPDGDGTLNLGSVYVRELWLDGEYGSEEDAPEYNDPIVAIITSECSVLDDGMLKVSCEFLKGFNKNDFVRFHFVDDPNADLLLYQIVSKVLYTDGEYYHCELMM